MITCASLFPHLLALRSYFCSFGMYAWNITYWLAILFQSRVCWSVAWLYFPAQYFGEGSLLCIPVAGFRPSLLALLWHACVYHHSSCQRAWYVEPPWFNIRTEGRRRFLISQYSYVTVWQTNTSFGVTTICIDISRIDLLLINTMTTWTINWPKVHVRPKLYSLDTRAHNCSCANTPTRMNGFISILFCTQYEPVREMKKREDLKLLTWVGQKTLLCTMWGCGQWLIMMSQEMCNMCWWLINHPYPN